MYVCMYVLHSQASPREALQRHKEQVMNVRVYVMYIEHAGETVMRNFSGTRMRSHVYVCVYVCTYIKNAGEYLDSYVDLFKAPLHEMNLPKPHPT